MKTLTKTNIFKALPALLLFLSSLLHASPKYSVGEMFSIIHYQDKEGVYMQVESINEHPFLDYYYEVSFHGICSKSPIGPLIFAFEDMLLSESSLSESSARKINTPPKEILTCTGIPGKPHLKNMNNSSTTVENGMIGVLISPLTPSLSSDSILPPERIITE
jgi:hypothetical protein